MDDEPAPAREWLPVLADALGAKPPRHFPVWLARLFAGELGVMLGTKSRGASNAKAKRELGWELRYPSWREGFFAAYSPSRNVRSRLSKALLQPPSWERTASSSHRPLWVKRTVVTPSALLELELDQLPRGRCRPRSR